MLPNTFGRFLWHFIKKQRYKFFFAQFFLCAWTIDETMMNVVIGNIVDSIENYTGDRIYAWNVLKYKILLGLILWTYVEFSYRMGGFLRALFFPKFEADIRTSVFHHIQRQSMYFFSKGFSGAIAQRIADLTDSSSRILDNLTDLFIPALFTIIITSVIFFTIHPTLSLMLIIWIVLHLLFSFFSSLRAAKLSFIHAQSRSDLQGRIVDSLLNFLNVTLFSGRKFESRYIQKFQKHEMELNYKKLIYLEKVRIILGILTLLFPGILLNYFTYQFWKFGTISTGNVIIIFYTTWGIARMVWTVSWQLPDIFKEVGLCQQALGLLQEHNAIQDAPNAKNLVFNEGKIEFKNVSFHYPDKPLIFNGISLTIAAGQKVGLVGYSGAGKSSLLNLLLRLYNIKSGQILIDGQDVSTVTQNSLHQKFAVIPQDSILFHRSIRENIVYGKNDATDEEIKRAATLANANHFIEALPDGYDSEVGERGTLLSGGQRQRIVIARAFLQDAPFLVLDEPTSGLDSKTESLIQESINTLMEGRTVLVIAHRLSTLKTMDRILVLDSGKIVEDGSHEQLVAKSGIYRELWDHQSGGYIEG